VARKKVTSPAKAPEPTAKADNVFRLKISLKHITPMIWRRVETPDCTLWDLHLIIQMCMPWANYHMWDFAVTQNERYGAEDDEEMEYDDAGRVKLSQLAARRVKKLAYMYDYGDGWEHIVTFEKPVARDPKAKYPRCVAGARACPPEDCGGFPGYEYLLEILANPKHEEYAERVAWLGGVYDPDVFDIDAINADLQKLKIKLPPDSTHLRLRDQRVILTVGNVSPLCSERDRDGADSCVSNRGRW
jgi:hypothetical protein